MWNVSDSHNAPEQYFNRFFDANKTLFVMAPEFLWVNFPAIWRGVQFNPPRWARRLIPPPPNKITAGVEKMGILYLGHCDGTV
jgi:hypothetical protein